MFSMNKKLVLVALAAAAFSLGVTAAYVSTPSGEECERIAQTYKTNSSFNGTMSCYPPEVLDVDPSDVVDKRTNTKCICRGVSNGEIRILNIAVAN